MEEQIIELIEQKKYTELRNVLSETNCTDISQLFTELSKENMIIVYRLLSKDAAADVFAYMEPELQETLINSFTDKELKEVIAEQFLDDTVDLIEEMPSNVVKRILKNVSVTERKLINEFLNYPSDSVGSIMTNEFVDLKENMTVEQAFEKIRKIGIDKETIYTCYVLTMSRQLIGVVTAKDLMLAEKTEKIKDIMDTNIISVNTLEDKEVAAKTFEKYDIIVLPVVDNETRLVGIVTIDDAIDVIQEENTEDIIKMAAMTPNEDTYFRTSTLRHAKNRIVWLLVLMLSATFTGKIITNYENAFSVIPLLVAFLPMIMGAAGNCGSQASTMIIRGLALDEIKLKDYFKAIWKETRIALIIGIVLAIVNGISIMLQYSDAKLVLIVGITLIGNIFLAQILGCILPLIAKKIKIDPAIMAAPLIATILDMCAVVIYFNIAMLVIKFM